MRPLPTRLATSISTAQPAAFALAASLYFAALCMMAKTTGGAHAMQQSAVRKPKNAAAAPVSSPRNTMRINMKTNMAGRAQKEIFWIKP